MTNVLALQEWLDVVRDEYLDGFIRDGGSSLKFAVPMREEQSSLLKDRFTAVARELGYLVVNVDSGETRVHMLQDVFFRIAEQVDWRGLARRVVIRLAREAGYRTETAELQLDIPVLEAISEASAVDESLIRLELRNPLAQSIEGCPGISGWP